MNYSLQNFEAEVVLVRALTGHTYRGITSASLLFYFSQNIFLFIKEAVLNASTTRSLSPGDYVGILENVTYSRTYSISLFHYSMTIMIVQLARIIIQWKYQE